MRYFDWWCAEAVEQCVDMAAGQRGSGSGAVGSHVMGSPTPRRLTLAPWLSLSKRTVIFSTLNTCVDVQLPSGGLPTSTPRSSTSFDDSRKPEMATEVVAGTRRRLRSAAMMRRRSASSAYGEGGR